MEENKRKRRTTKKKSRVHVLDVSHSDSTGSISGHSKTSAGDTVVAADRRLLKTGEAKRRNATARNRRLSMSMPPRLGSDAETFESKLRRKVEEKKRRRASGKKNHRAPSSAVLDSKTISGDTVVAADGRLLKTGEAKRRNATARNRRLSMSMPPRLGSDAETFESKLRRKVE